MLLLDLQNNCYVVIRVKKLLGVVIMVIYFRSDRTHLHFEFRSRLKQNWIFMNRWI